jgi:hypothetical protein
MRRLFGGLLRILFDQRLELVDVAEERVTDLLGLVTQGRCRARWRVCTMRENKTKMEMWSVQYGNPFITIDVVSPK